MKPALTAEEWAKLDLYEDWGHEDCEICDRARHWRHLGSAERHELAALCLYGQPFGFTREDVTALAVAADELMIDNDVQTAICIEDIRQRIEALLPPEGQC